ncbi:MAG: hypothetical protein ACLPTZ_28880 [Beijerinckiaceae bacterium]
MEATEQVTRHAVHIQAHRLLIQQMIIQLQSIKPSIVQEIYANVNSELQDQHASKTEDLKRFEAKVDAHVAELLSGVGLRTGSA